MYKGDADRRARHLGLGHIPKIRDGDSDHCGTAAHIISEGALG
jgi:hypothetical protein